MTIGKDTRVFKIIRTNKMSLKEDVNILGGFSLAGLLCHDFCSSQQGITPQYDDYCE
jgi:hypothetical protein